MIYLVTGCAGFIGSHLTESLLVDGHEVTGIDCFNENYDRTLKIANLRRLTSWDSFQFVPIDMSRGELHGVVTETEAAFHLAAEPGVRSSWDARFERYVRNNVIGTKSLLDAASGQDEYRVVYASSSSVYGDATDYPTSETAVPRPRSPYGVTKLSAEHLCHAYAASGALTVVSLRYFTVFGPRQRPDMAFHKFCRALLAREPITIFGDGQQTRDFTFVGDIVHGTRAAMETAPASNVYNVGGGSPTTLAATIDLLREISGLDTEVRYLPQERGDVRDTAADTSAAKRDLGYNPTTDLATGLAAEFAWATDLAAASGSLRQRLTQGI